MIRDFYRNLELLPDHDLSNEDKLNLLINAKNYNYTKCVSNNDYHPCKNITDKTDGLLYYRNIGFYEEYFSYKKVSNTKFCK